MEWNFDQLGADTRYKLLASLVIPRPIAWITTADRAGLVNAAPFSYFNVIGEEPPLLMVSIENRDAGPLKDTARNILDTQAFVVNMVDEAVLAQMHASSQDFPPEVGEPAALGLRLAASRAVAPPRLCDSPVSFECRVHTHLDLGMRHVIIGQVHWLHVRDGIVDPASCRVSMADYHPVGRLFANRYVTTREEMSVEPNSYNEARIRRGRL